MHRHTVTIAVSSEVSGIGCAHVHVRTDTSGRPNGARTHRSVRQAVGDATGEFRWALLRCRPRVVSDAGWPTVPVASSDAPARGLGMLVAASFIATESIVVLLSSS